MRLGRRAIITFAVLGFLLLLVGGRSIAVFLSEILWYRSLGLEGVFWTEWRAGILVRGFVGLIVGVIVYLNLWIVTRSLGAIRVRRRYGNIEIAEVLPKGYLFGALTIVALLSAWWLSSSGANALEVVAAFRPVPWGLRDPLFGFDAAFYVFQLPILNRFQTLGALVIFWIALLAVAAYIATGAIKLTEGKPAVSALARRHLGTLVSVFLLFFAVHVWLDRYGLVVSGGGFGNALGYTDVHARLPAKLLIFLLALVAAAATAYGSWIGNLRLPIAALVLLVLGLIGADAIYAPSVQRFVVEPNEFPREQPYIENHLAFSRAAYKLTDVESISLPYQRGGNLLEEGVLVDRIKGIPLWDPRPLLTTYQQRQAPFPYYTFASVHHDRYEQNGASEPVAVAVRELDTSALEQAAQTWQNLHLYYVSGEGAVVSPVARMAGDGTPIFYVWDLDPPKLSAEAPPELELRDPSIYFGERTDNYVILGPDTEPIGITLDSPWKKLLFAWAFQSKNILLSADLTSDSKLVFRRNIADRVQASLPFLEVLPEGGAYPVISDGRVVWVVDAYAMSRSFPLSPLVGLGNRGIRYVRNSVKATVDAVTGEVNLYSVDTTDPILATYSRIFPGLIQPLEAMPEDLQRHLRYPIPLMHLQAQVLGAYHLVDPREFYGQLDVWSLATEQYRGTPTPMEPTFGMYPLPGSDQSEFLLSVPYVARGRQNMTALLVTRNDPPHYGEQILYLLPRDETVPGPQQVEAAIDQDPDISQQLSLWRRGGSDVIRGHLMVVPVAGTLVYVEPLFLEAENAAIPQLERVILATSGRVVMQPTFESAVRALLSTSAGAESESSPIPAEASGSGNPVRAEAVATARRLLGEAENQLRAGDWAAFGRTWEALRDALSEPSESP